MIASPPAKFVPAAPPPSPEEVKAELAKAEDAVRAWYLEWSQVVRIAVTDRTLLKQLGFLADRGTADDTKGDPAVPATATPVVAPVAPAASPVEARTSNGNPLTLRRRSGYLTWDKARNSYRRASMVDGPANTNVLPVLGPRVVCFDDIAELFSAVTTSDHAPAGLRNALAI